MITLRQIVQNIGKGQSGVAVKYILAALTKNYNTVKGKIQIVNSRVLNDGTIVHLKIPSSDKAISYDVVFWLDSLTRVRLDTKFKCYSNSPSFAYNFAYIFNTQDSLLFPEKYPHEFVAMPPKTRNPFGLYGFDKHVFSAVKYIGSRDLRELNDRYRDVSEQPIISFTEKKSELSRL